MKCLIKIMANLQKELKKAITYRNQIIRNKYNPTYKDHQIEKTSNHLNSNRI